MIEVRSFTIGFVMGVLIGEALSKDMNIDYLLYARIMERLAAHGIELNASEFEECGKIVDFHEKTQRDKENAERF